MKLGNYTDCRGKIDIILKYKGRLIGRPFIGENEFKLLKQT